MDDEDFDDLLAGVDLLEDSSQESLTLIAANNAFCEDIDLDRGMEKCPTFSDTRVDIHNAVESELEHAQGENGCVSELPSLGNVDESKDAQQAPSPENTVLAKIEAVFHNIEDALLNDEDDLVISLKTRRTRAKVAAYSMDGSISKPAMTRSRPICFPGKTAEEAWRFTVVIRILEMIHEALLNDALLSKRDIYYRDPALFGRQTHVDRYVDDIAFTFGVQRSLLNVTAVAKGLVAGAVRFCRRDGSLLDAAGDKEGVLVPSLRDILSADVSAVRWILVVEKEASFRSIAGSTFWDATSMHGIIITAKGYPDIATRALLHFLSMPSPQNGFASPEVFGLVDFDPDGLAILSVYKHGSLALSHENSELHVPQMQWLGLHADHMKLSGGDVHASQGLLELTTRDRKKAIKMLEAYHTSDDKSDCSQLQRALQTMLMWNMKAELQLLDSRPEGRSMLLNAKLGNI